MKKMIRAAIAALGVAGAAMSGAAAQSDSTVVAAFDEQTLGAILTAGGVQWRVVDRGEDGSVRIQAERSGFPFVIQTRVCRQGACIGAHLFTLINGQPPAEMLNTFDTNQPFISAGVLQDGTGWIARYFISDYGIPVGNIKSNISNFVSIASYFVSEYAAQAQQISFEGEAAHTAAEHLNSVEALRVKAKPVSVFPEYATWSHAVDNYDAFLSTEAAQSISMEAEKLRTRESKVRKRN